MGRNWGGAWNEQDRDLKRAGQENGRGRAEAVAVEQQGWSRAAAGKGQGSSKVGVVHIPVFTQIVPRHRSY